MPQRMCLFWLFLLLAVVAVMADEVKTTYLLAAKDEIAVTVLKHPELSASYTVPPDGMIDFPRAGRINLLGQTVAAVATALTDKYGDFLNHPEVTVVLTKARTRTAFVMGAVNKPGEYPISENTKISELIAAAGDLLGERKELTATLKRAKTVIPVDLQAVLNGANPLTNLAIEDGDLLTIIAPVKITITVLGMVKTPGPAKLLPNSTPVDALAQAGDVTDRPERMKIILMHGPTSSKLAWDDHKTVLQDGDVIMVEKETVVRVTVSGQVKNPGGYELLEGGGVMEAITLAGGAMPTAALRKVTILHPNNTSEQVNLSKAFNTGVISTRPQVSVAYLTPWLPVYLSDKAANTNPKLNPGDQVIVPQWNETFSVFGSVSKADKFLLSETAQTRLLDALSMAGIDSKNAKTSDIVLIRTVDHKQKKYDININDIMKHGRWDLNVTLQPNDVIYVPEKRQTATGILGALQTMGIVLSGVAAL